MIFINNPLEVLGLVTSSAASLDYSITHCHFPTSAAFYDATDGKVAVASTHPLLSNPNDASKQVAKLITIRNADPTLSTTITLQKSIGSVDYTITPDVTLLPGEVYQYMDQVGWTYYAADGTIKTDVGTGINTISGTLNRITVVGGINAVIDIASNYVGQTSITTLGTITTGTWGSGAIIAGVTMTLGSDASYDTYYRSAGGILTRLSNGTTGQVLTATTGGAPSWTSAWSGSVIDPMHGGTGVANNNASTLTWSGSFASTFTIAGAFNYTFPTATSTLLANNLGLSGGSTLIGGTAVTDVLNLQGTSGNGTSTVATINFKVGNAGATTAGIIYNDGILNWGVAAKPGGALSIARFGIGTSFVDIGEVSSGNAGLWMNQATPTSTTYTLFSGGNATTLNAPNTSSSIFLAYTGVTKYTFARTSIIFTPTLTTANATTTFTFTVPNNTAQTLSTAIPQVLYTMGNTQWAQGAIAAHQPFYKITQPTISFATGSSTATLTSTFYIAGAPNSGTNAVQTACAALYIDTAAVNSVGTAGISYGVYINAQSGATTNTGLFVNGSVVISAGGTSLNVTGNVLFNNALTVTGQTTLNGAINSTITMNDGKNFVFNATTGTIIATATTQKLGFWGVAPIIQPAGATQAAPAAYVTGAFGLDSNANMQALYDLVVAMRTALVNSGLIKGAA